MVGGLMAIPERARVAGAKPLWTGYIGVDDVDAYVDRVQAAGGALIGGMMTKMPDTPVPFWLYYSAVDAIDAAAVRVQAGGRVITDPMQVPGGRWIVHCLDPQGAIFALVAQKR